VESARSSTPARPRRLPAVDVPASIAGIVAGVVTTAAIVLGSRGLRTFDAALVGYATATIFLAFGVAYRYVVWVQSPPAMRYLRRGWASFLSFRNFRRFPTLVPRAVVSGLAFQTFIARRGPGRWLAHQAVFWGVVLATLITFPLTFGWISFEAVGSGSRYAIVVWGFRTITFEPVTWFGWLVFHALDVAAVLVIAGCAYFLWRRFRDREATTGQRFGYDFLPLVSLVAISVTGLLLTLSSSLLEGEGYEFLAIIHMATVVLTLVFIPFGKFFHVIQRPASVGVEVYKQTSMEREGVLSCRRCGEPLEATTFIRDLQATMTELGLRYERWIETCPRCKRVLRGQAYLRDVKGGFR
jgi:hypothetical protein